jgi:hypothetical protein
MKGALALAALLSGGFAVWTDGSLYSIRELVAKVNGLQSEFSRENTRLLIFAPTCPIPTSAISG